MEVHGFNGDVTFGTGLTCGALITGFSANLDIDQVEVPPPFGSKMKKTKLGAGKFSGTLRGHLQYNASGSLPFDVSSVGTGKTNWDNMEGSLTLQCEEGCTIVMTASLFNFQIERENGGLATFSCQFANSEDDLVVTWDQTP